MSYCHCALWQVPLFIPETRRGRATLETDPANGQGKRGTIRVENNPDENTAMLKALIETVVNGEQPQEQPIIQVIKAFRVGAKYSFSRNFSQQLTFLHF